MVTINATAKELEEAMNSVGIDIYTSQNLPYTARELDKLVEDRREKWDK